MYEDKSVMSVVDIKSLIVGKDCSHVKENRKKMVSAQEKSDMEMLLGMEIKLRLLDTEGVRIPAKPPAIPPEPDNYNFVYAM
ncbi:engulfment and cell motility protein 1-like [Octopus bimaculoides]|uniref:engulfment and cell motility protein 1-like n=1 Tax=Octopus bimaculoides TaxID=37653 RepID=UPI00071C6205|nr:engulfment and cell motility protein 1-like [Octopus bimaculoides]|eukprot:XP_014785018.1 PREDICTED: engulfment and cell motility protein 1-like [Octopus bimaculoides]